MSESFRARLLRGEVLIGTLLSLPAPELAEIAAGSGFDWLFLDLEHGTLETRDLPHMVRAAGESCAPVIRVPENKEMWINASLDSGAAGLIIPHVNTAEEAASAVLRAKYPPEGNRSIGFSRANRFGTRLQEHVETANRETAVIAQVEHIEGARNIEKILDTPGLDGVFVGPYDLSASLGKPGRIREPEVEEAVLSIRNACAVRQTPVGIFALDIQSSLKALEEGYTFLCSGIDVGLFSAAAKDILGALRS